MLVNLTIEEFLDKTAGNDPVPGGGSISALSGALAAALAGMVANLTVGRKRYEEHWAEMEKISASANEYRRKLAKAVDEDSDAYNRVFEAFKLPKETDAEKTERGRRIQEATKHAAEVPFEVAKEACALMDIICAVAEKGNSNAITDAAVAAMAARTAVLGAILNVRINLSSIKDEEYVSRMEKEAGMIEKEAADKENKILEKVRKKL